MEQFTKLTAKLSELFELEKADLDFGIHRIIKARQQQIRTFLSGDTETDAPTLRKIVLREMGEANTAELESTLNRLTDEIRNEYGNRAFDGDDKLVNQDAKTSADGQAWLHLREQLDTGSAEANEQLEADIYSHLTTFFSRYYDDADFVSKRRIKAGAEPYAVSYSGEEVMLHWANKDQYYIKSSKDLKDYTFTLNDTMGKDLRVQFKCQRQDPVLNNNNAKREFHLDDEAEIEVSGSSLVIPFHFKIVERTRTQAQQKEWIASILEQLPVDWQKVLKQTAEDAVNNLITRHLNNYSRKNESDFFIHKHLGKFLNGELDFYIKNEVMHLDDIDDKSTDYLTAQVRKIKAIRTIAKHIITFLAQLENFQKKIWLKKKVITETHYCFTLDRIFEHSPDLIETLLSGIDKKIRRYDGQMRSQQDEWIKLYAIDALDDYPKAGKLTEAFLKAHDKLMLDTVFYDLDFKYQILAALPDIEEALNGFIVHSDNFQALSLITNRFENKIDSIYIDPPYNATATEILYKNEFKHSSWCSLIENRVSLNEALLRQSGVICVTIDDYEYHRLKEILDRVVGVDNFLGTVVIRNNPSGRSTVNGFAICHEYALFYSKDPSEVIIGRLPHNQAQRQRYDEMDEEGRSFEWENFRKSSAGSSRSDRPKQYYPLFVKEGSATIRLPELGWNEDKREWAIVSDPTSEETVIYPLDSQGRQRVWNFGIDRTSKEQEKLKAEFKNGKWEIYKRKYIREAGILPRTWWEKPEYSARDSGTRSLERLFSGQKEFDFPKALTAVEDCMRASNLQEGGITLDYFGGSGTTAHAVINLNREDSGDRNYILVEMGDHFDTVLKPRIQKVVYSADWKDGKPTAPKTGISHGFKYLRLESYEDALNNLDLGTDRSADLLGLGDSVREDYLFSYMLDVETRDHLMNLERFRDPWGCQLKIHDPHTGKSDPRVIDLIETFNYLIGITVRELKVRDGFLTIEGENPAGDTILILWRKLEGESTWPSTTNAELVDFATKKLRLNPADTEYHAIYLNGDHTLEDPHSKIHCTEEVFYERMFANTGNPED